ncbi:MAG: PD40 domain-containing protein, partial [Gemmatimonadetes bacterium]|nr:PD40 domain-containing protein [Gemmatimonadota bacterium]
MERIAIGPWTVDPVAREVAGPAGTRRLEPKPLALLLHLVANAGRVVPRQELLTAAWGDEMATDDLLSRSISELRRALGDDPRAPAFVETIRGTGYRLVVPVLAPGDGAGLEADVPELAPSRASVSTIPRRFAARRWLVGALTIAVLGSLWIGRARERGVGPGADPHLVPLTTERGQAQSPRVSLDGTRVAYIWRDTTGRDAHLVVQLLNGGNRVEIARGVAPALAWAPDGSRLAFLGTDAAGQFLGIAPSLGGPVRVLARVPEPPVLGIDWSADGRWIALAMHDEPFTPFRVVLVSADSASTHRLTTAGRASVGDAFPAFAPDGRAVAFARFATETAADVFLVDRATGAERRLTSEERNITALHFAPDGRSIVYATDRDGGSALWRVPLDGARAERIVGSEHVITGVTSDGAGARFVVSAGEPNQVLMATSATPGRSLAEPLTPSTRSDGLPSVSPINGRLAFISDRSGGREVWMASARGDSAVQLTSNG